MNAQFMDYMKGWRLAAGGLAIPPGTVENEDFLLGWKDGKSASRTAQHFAADRFKTTIRYVREATPPTAQTPP